MYQHLLFAVEGPVATLTLHRPERKNAIGPTMVNDLLYALEAVQKDSAVRVVVLTGSGNAFCSGGDLGQMSSGSSDAPEREPKGDYADLLLALTRFPKPLVARVKGPAMGGGLGLVAACPFAIASDDAVFGTPELNLGLFPMMIMAVLARTMPRRALLDMMLFARKLPAEEAARLGIINRAVPSERLDSDVAETVKALAERSPTAISRGLAAYAKMNDLALEQSLPYLRDELYALLGTEDAQEGLRAFFEKRTAVWTGR